MKMGHTLVIDLPEEVFEPLVKSADRTGRTPEETALHWLQDAARRSSEDPIEKFIGSLGSTVPDWADQHDKYLGGALVQEVRENPAKED
jgi:hypothetical protein